MLAWIQRSIVRMRRSGVGGLIRATSCVPFNLSSGPHVDEQSSWLPWLSRSNHAHPPCLTQYCAAVRIVPRTATWHIDAAVLQQYSSVSEPSAKFYIVYCHLLQCFTTGDAFTLICVYEHVHSYLFWFYFLYCDLMLCLTTRDAFTFDTCNWILLTYLLIQCEEFISELLMVSSETSKRTSKHPRTAVKRTNNLRFLTPQNPRMHGR